MKGEGARMKFLFLFLDGVGLGADDVETNPFASAQMPNLENLLGGQRLIQNHRGFPIHTPRATLLALDACLGIEGRPQSASGQATLLTGKNVPALIGEHYGPKPNPKIRAIVENSNIFSTLQQAGYRTSFLNAFPAGYFQGLDSGRRIPGAVAMAARAAGVPIKTQDDLFNGQALSADFTAQGWWDHLKSPDTPILTPEQAGIRLKDLTFQQDFAFFEYWLSDYAGHKGDMANAQSLLSAFDQVLGGLLSAWEDEEGLILLTSDHGNLEDLSVRKHTRNPVPALVIGSAGLREAFTQNSSDLTDVYPGIMHFFQIPNSS
jgi:2,3-bisphosphoglycerate-independent phosphoglycerate mutase